MPTRGGRLSRPSSTESLITTESRYTLGRRLGRGGFGSVYLATREVALDEQRFTWNVAIKVVPNEGRPERAAFEAAVLASLRCPQIVPLLDAFVWKDHTWLVMEYVEGRDLGRLLSEFVRKQERPDDQLIIRVGLEIARALRWAHRTDLGRPAILHADIKPSNILVGLDGNLRLADFGLGVVMERHGVEAAGARGTPGYIAPELAARGDLSGGLCDVYSLGVVLWEMASGLAPPERGGVLDDVRLVSRWRESRPKQSRLDPLILKMVSSRPSLRPSAADCVDELQRLAGDKEAARESQGGATGHFALNVRALLEQDQEQVTLPAQPWSPPPPAAPRPASSSPSAPAPVLVPPEPTRPRQDALSRGRAWVFLAAVALLLGVLLWGLISTTGELEQAHQVAASADARVRRAQAEAQKAREELARVQAERETTAAPAPVEAAPIAAAPPEAAPETAPTAAAPPETAPRASSRPPSGTVVMATQGLEASVAGIALKPGPNSVPVGRYPLSVLFPGLSEPMEFHKIEVRQGRTVTVKCSVEAFTCSF